MPGSARPKILVMYSCPSDQPPLRLDKEHRAIDLILQKHKLDSEIVRRFHATSVQDFSKILRENDYEIVQFSGHGSHNAFCLEHPDKDKSALLSAEQVARTVQDALPRLRVAIFISCFSSSAIPNLIKVAPFLITIQGEADDNSAIEFISTFYDEYFRYNKIEPAFASALLELDCVGRAESIKPILTRRAKVKSGFVIQACFERKADSVFIDLTEAESDIDALGISRDDFLSLLTRKIRLHQWVFRYSRENALLSIGKYYGLFSWQDAEDIVTCHRVMKLKQNVDDATCEAWTSLLVAYNDLRCQRYRIVPSPASPENAPLLKQAIGQIELCLNKYLSEDKNGGLLRAISPEQFKVSRATARANLNNAESKFYADDYQSTVYYLELAVSTIHDLVDTLTNELTEQPYR